MANPATSPDWSKPVTAAHRTSANVADAAEALRAALINTYGVDFSFVIHGHGRLVAASNMNLGVVNATAH